MKFIKRAKLAFKEGNSDKVYEVDLCELINESEQRYLVNFRYGRRGAVLREGTKTPIPIGYQQAEDVFNSLVIAKMNKGYVDVATLKSQSGQSSSGNSFDLNAYLSRIDEEKDSDKRARLIWRLSRKANAELASWLTQGLGKGNWQENYSRLWVIGHTGDSSHAQAVVPFLDDIDSILAALALEVLLKFGDENANRIKQDIINALPHELIYAIKSDDKIAIAKQLAVYLTDEKNDRNSLLKNLYLIALESPVLHQVLVDLIKTIPIKPGFFKGLRYMFKMAEFRFDSVMFATLSYRFETTKPYFNSDWYWNYSYRSQPSRLQKELAKPNCNAAFSDKTRDYLRRRSWRTLKRLGARDDDRYVDMAAELLLLFSEEDKKSESSVERYSWDERKNVTFEYDGYSSYLILNEILRSNSYQFKMSASRKSWVRVSQNADNHRTEAFPEIWDRHPELLLKLLTHSRAEIVGEFVARALKDNQTFCDQISDEALYQLLMSTLQPAIEFAVDLLQKREISHSLLIQLFKSGNEKARTVALNALNQIKDVFAEPKLLVSLLLIDFDELNHWITAQCKNHHFGYADYALLDEVADALLLSDATLTEQHAGWLAQVFIQHIETAVNGFSIDKIKALFDKDNAGVQLFAAYLLNANSVAFNSIPQTVLDRINGSDSAAMRAIGIALFSKTSEYELLNQLPLLVELIYRGEPEERQACFGILEKLALAYGQQIFDQLQPLVFKEEIQPGQQNELFEFINRHLVRERDKLDKNSVWRLIHASSAAAQRLGAEILCSYDITAFTIKQWVTLAGNPNQKIRSLIHQAFEQNVSFIKENSRDALRVLESRWQDSREFGIAFFNKYYQESDWSVELIVSVCDSNQPQAQAYGRELLQTYFKPEQGEEYLQKLSQHPSIQVQAFVSHLLNDYAAGKPEVILSLRHYFTSVLSQINKGRVSKDCVLAFLIQQANCDETVLNMVTELFTRLSLTLVHKDKSQLIKAMLMLKKQHPDLVLPIKPQQVRVLTAVQGENHAS